MTLRSWSGRRLLAAWGAGLALQALLLAGTYAVARRALADGPRILRQAEAHDERRRVADAADSLSVVAQRRAAIADGEFTVSPQGDTLVAVARTPSGRPGPRPRAQVERRARVTSAFLVGAIPLSLLGLTAAWAVARRGRASVA